MRFLLLIIVLVGIVSGSYVSHTRNRDPRIDREAGIWPSPQSESVDRAGGGMAGRMFHHLTKGKYVNFGGPNRNLKRKDQENVNLIED